MDSRVDIDRATVARDSFTLTRRRTGNCGSSFLHLLNRFLGIVHKLTDGFASVSMINHLGQELWRHGDDVRPC